MPAKLQGLEALRRNLQAVLTEVQTAVVIETLTQGAERMQGAISLRAPHDTGQLAGDIVIAFKFARGVGVALVGPSQESFYGRFLEYGTVRQSARPFMRPALDEDGAKIIAFMAAHSKARFTAMRSQV